MPATSLFLALRRQRTFITNSCWIERSSCGRFLSSAASGGEQVVVEEEDEFHSSGNGDDLRSRILRLRLPKRSATTIIDRWIGEGNLVTSSELRAISRELRKSQRYKHALEISEWMVSREGFEVLDSDYATRIDLMTKVFGIDAAERYFESLPPAGKTAETYTALLHSYAGAKMIDKAEELYERMKESDLSFTAVTYNEIMTLHMSVGKLERVASVVHDLKDRNVAPDIFTYNLWISSCAANLDIDEARRVLDEMSSSPACNDDWLRYIRIANLYVTAGHIVNGETGAVVEADKSITQREWITYDFLVILYAGLQNKERIDQIWKSLRMTKQKMTSRNYVCILSSYLVLGHLKEAGEVIDQWKLSTETEFDASACSRLLDALSGNELTEAANDFRILLIERNCDPTIASE
ncbi:Pentatricopeptide repeat-containing protein At5g09450, mitochondrial [Linum perenne]